MSREGRGLRAPWVDNSGKGQTEVILKEPESLTHSWGPWEGGGRNMVTVDMCPSGRSTEYFWGAILKAFNQNWSKTGWQTPKDEPFEIRVSFILISGQVGTQNRQGKKVAELISGMYPSSLFSMPACWIHWVFYISVNTLQVTILSSCFFYLTLISLC